MKTFFKKLFTSNKIRCPECNSNKMEYGEWNGGWNKLCNQAFGRNGHRCYDCGYIIWKETNEEFKKILPSWCKISKRYEKV